MNKKLLCVWMIPTALLVIPLAGCEPSADKPSDSPSSTNRIKSPAAALKTSTNRSVSVKAVAELTPTEGNEARGTVTFTTEDEWVRVVGDFSGLEPGSHGFHIHEKGDCSAPDGSSAGGHFNPVGEDHGAPGDNEHHTGDLGNIVADESGKAHLEKNFAFLDLSGEHSIIGRGVIIHQGEDDFSTNPGGASGKRLACGIIRLAP